jgi:uncharacterized protein (TIGR02466 family)
MPHERGDAEFITLWPTTLMKRVIPGHAPANRALAGLITRLEEQNENLTTDYRDGNFLTIDDSGAGWLRQCVNVTVKDYFRQLGMSYDIKWRLHGWANINRFGDYHDPHNHPHAYLSGTYYVSVPDDIGRTHSRADLRPGCLTLYDPRGAVNMAAIKDDPYIEPEYTVSPEPGLILLWPAFLSHFVHPNLSEQPRISVSFNVMLEWSDDYLPTQK